MPSLFLSAYLASLTGWQAVGQEEAALSKSLTLAQTCLHMPRDFPTITSGRTEESEKGSFWHSSSTPHTYTHSLPSLHPHSVFDRCSVWCSAAVLGAPLSRPPKMAPQKIKNKKKKQKKYSQHFLHQDTCQGIWTGKGGWCKMERGAERQWDPQNMSESGIYCAGAHTSRATHSDRRYGCVYNDACKPALFPINND